MTNVDITQNLRPLRLAYIVRPNDMASLTKVIETNSFLWGSRYNPVLPLHKRTPQYLKNNFRINKIGELLHGNLRFFEPDFIVTTGNIHNDEIENPPCEIIKFEDICENIGEEGLPGYGIGLWEILRDYYDKDFKFLRRDNLSHYFPLYGQGNNCFLKSAFGTFPQNFPEPFVKNMAEALEANQERITLDNYLSFLKPSEALNVHRLNSYDLEIDYTKHIIRERNVIFVLDPASFIDIVDYINLKAAGYSVLPILRASLQLDQAKELCLKFIEDKAWVHKDNPHATSSITMQKSCSVTKKELEKFYRFVDPPKFEGQNTPKCFKRFDLPDFWSRWDQEKGRVSCTSVTVRKKETTTVRDEKYARLEVIAPSFMSDRMPKPYKARFANDISVNTFSFNKETFDADIYPSNSDEVARAAGLLGMNEWLIKDSGITKLCRSETDLIFFNIQNAEEIFLGWLKSEGWDAKISDAGKVAYQMLKHLGGPWGITLLQGEKLIKFLVGKNDEDGMENRALPSSGIANRIFRARLKEAYNDHHISWGEDRFIKGILERNIFQLGTELRCDVCARRSWHPIDSLNYTVKCPHCLNMFEIPSHDPDSIKWSYKTIGPFSAAGKAAGAYCVLLAAKFFNKSSALDNATTTVLSFDAEKSGLKIEADLGLFYREESHSNRNTELIFCECKTYRRFVKKDIDTMKVVAKEFPGSMLVFATLNNHLTHDEKKILTSFVNTCNKYHERDRPKNPVMILTANELCAYTRPPFSWRNKGGRYEEFAQNHQIHSLLSICQATQKIYLGLESWWSNWERVWEQRTAIRAKKA